MARPIARSEHRASLHAWGASTAAVLCLSMAAPAAAQYYSFKSYAQSFGLKNSAVTTLAQDRAGYLWAGTQSGLYRYDGSRFTAMGGKGDLPSFDIVALQPAAGGAVWVTTRTGVAIARGTRVSPVPIKTPLEVDGTAHTASDR